MVVYWSQWGRHKNTHKAGQFRRDTLIVWLLYLNGNVVYGMYVFCLRWTDSVICGELNPVYLSMLYVGFCYCSPLYLTGNVRCGMLLNVFVVSNWHLYVVFCYVSPLYRYNIVFGILLFFLWIWQCCMWHFASALRCIWRTLLYIMSPVVSSKSDDAASATLNVFNTAYKNSASQSGQDIYNQDISTCFHICMYAVTRMWPWWDGGRYPNKRVLPLWNMGCFRFHKYR